MYSRKYHSGDHVHLAPPVVGILEENLDLQQALKFFPSTTGQLKLRHEEMGQVILKPTYIHIVILSQGFLEDNP